MELEDRIRYWMKDPEMTRESALEVIAQEDADHQLGRLDELIHRVEGAHAEGILRRIEKATRDLVNAMAAEAGLSISIE